MANKGKNTNSSQLYVSFSLPISLHLSDTQVSTKSFITYREAKHLDRKHTIFGKIVGGLETLTRLENVPTDSSDRPMEKIEIIDIVVFVDPFEEFQKQKREREEEEREREAIQRSGGREDERTTWTGKRIRRDGGDGGGLEGGGGGGGSGGSGVTVGKYLKATNTTDRRLVEDEIVGGWENDIVVEEPSKKKMKGGGGGFGNFDNW